MKITIEGDRAILQSRATPRLLAILPALEGQRKWLKNGHLSFARTAHNLETILAAFPSAVVATGNDSGGQPHASAFDPGRGSYRSKTEPFDHQIRALEKMRTRPAFALFMEQGTGKTKAAIDRAGELFCAGKITGVLVVAKKGVHRQWMESQVPMHLGVDWNGSYWNVTKHVTAPQSGSGGLEWFAINFDGAKAPKGKAACFAFAERHKGKLLIVADETQEIKNVKSARHKALVAITAQGSSPYRLALTGTPIAKDLTDEWAQLRWLNEDVLGIRYITTFRNEYCVMGGFEGRVVVAHKNLARFREKVDPHTFRATKDELGILPKAYREWTFDLSLEQRKMIRTLRQELLAELKSGEVVSAANAAVALTKIQQISNGFIADASGAPRMVVTEEQNPRLAALQDVLDAYDGQTIVWARFRFDIALIAERLEAMKVSFVEYHGGTKDDERASAVEAFLRGDARVFLATPQAGGTGLNLQGSCRHAVYYSNGFNAIDRWQSEDRIHRIGTTGVCVYTDLVCAGAADKTIMTNLRKKKGISDLAIGELIASLEEDQ